MEFVANRKYLSLNSEYTLFSAVVSWAINEARRRQVSTDDWISIRTMLNEHSIFKALRFLAMRQDEFARAVMKTSSTLDTANLSSLKVAQLANENQEANGFSAGQAEAAPDQVRVDVDSHNSLLTEAEQRSVFMNLALPNSARVPESINGNLEPRLPPPEYFSLCRFRSSSPGSSQTSLITTTTSTRGINLISTKFQCLSENVFIVALTIPIRLDVSSAYVSRSPKFECHLKFTTKTTSASSKAVPDLTGLAAVAATSPLQHDGSEGSALDGATLLMDSIDESLHISISRDKDCLVKLKRPILIRVGNINELTLNFQTYALDEDIVALRTPKTRSANFSELTDSEGISWLFFKTPNVEFSEIHYYY